MGPAPQSLVCPPLLLFHGSDAEFSEFRLPDGPNDPADSGLGVFLTEDEDIGSFALSRATFSCRKPWVYAAHVTSGLRYKHYDAIFPSMTVLRATPGASANRTLPQRGTPANCVTF